MATSTQRAVSNGTLVLLDLSINYLDRSEIAVYVNAVLSTTWAWVGTTDKQIKFTPAVANGLEVLVKRTTDLSKLRHAFSGGAAFEAAVLDEALKQVLHIAQEGAEIRDFNNEVSMQGFKITNLADAVNPTDALNLRRANVELAPQVAAANASAATATTQATNASNSAAAAAASYDSFDDRYLGPKAVAPTLDNDGAALLTGALYWDTAIPVMRAYTGTAWVNLPAATASAVANTPAGNIAATTVQAALNELDSEKQPLDATLTALAALATGADKLAYSTGTDTFAETPLTAFARTLLDDADAAAARATLGIVEAASFTSAEQVITSAGGLTIAHGLGTVPRYFQGLLICKVAQAGYAVGAILPNAVAASGSLRNISLVVDATNLVIRYNDTADAFLLNHATTGVATVFTNANWTYVIRAFK